MRVDLIQIGDYFAYPTQTIHDGNLKIGRVNFIRHDGIVQIDFVDTNAQLLEPIAITPSILENNGFIHSFGDSDFYDYEKWEKKVDDKTIRVIKDHDGWFCRVDDNKLTRSMGIAPSVHTMQNIIRIGGIEKTIEL